MSISHTILPEFDQEMSTTRKILEDGVTACREAIANASDADLQVMWSLKRAGHTLFSMPRSAVLRSMVMNHIIHHRAQLGVFLRLNDIPLPSSYGPTADEQPM